MKNHFSKNGFSLGLLIFLLLSLVSIARADNCSGKFINPIVDICWECMFPITIGNMELVGGDLPDTKNPSLPLCFCGAPPRIGINAGFWEPFRVADVTKRPFCFVNLGGKTLDLGFDVGTNSVNRTENQNNATWHIHWYIYPILSWLNILIDFSCMEDSKFDIAYLSELDPLWQDDALALILDPEAMLFTSLPAHAACSADCVASSSGLPIDSLFWCAGCQGSFYPLNGRVAAHVSSVQSSLLTVERLTYKLHRQLQLWGTMSDSKTCEKYPMPIIQKSQYRAQLTYPSPSDCYPYGRSTVLYEANREFPVKGEDFGYLIWRKRNCCVF